MAGSEPVGGDGEPFNHTADFHGETGTIRKNEIETLAMETSVTETGALKWLRKESEVKDRPVSREASN